MDPVIMTAEVANLRTVIFPVVRQHYFIVYKQITDIFQSHLCFVNVL